MTGFISLITAAALAVDIGWQPLPEGGVEYVLQLGPAAVDALARGEEIISDVPPQLQRVRRWRVRSGDRPLAPAASAAGEADAHSDTDDSRATELRAAETGNSENEYPAATRAETDASSAAREPGADAAGADRYEAARQITPIASDPSPFATQPRRRSSSVPGLVPVEQNTATPYPEDDGTIDAEPVIEAGGQEPLRTTPPPSGTHWPPRDNTWRPADEAWQPPVQGPVLEPAGALVASLTRPPSRFGRVPAQPIARRFTPVEVAPLGSAEDAAAPEPPRLAQYDRVAEESRRRRERRAPIDDEPTEVEEETPRSPARIAANRTRRPSTLEYGEALETAARVPSPEPVTTRRESLAEERPWLPLLGAFLALFLSLGANVYLSWVGWEQRERYRELLSRWRRVRDRQTALDQPI